MPSKGQPSPSRATGSPPDHRANRFLAALDAEDFAVLEPHLEAVILPRGTVLYEPGDPIRYTYFPHDAIVSLVDVMEDGRLAEVAIFGREGLFGLLSAFVSREAFGRYVVQVPAPPRGFPSSTCIQPSRPALLCNGRCSPTTRRCSPRHITP
jgi:CRP-like cAMP-binding protein